MELSSERGYELRKVSVNQAPSTATQLILVIIVLLPGVTYQLLRERWRGPLPGEQQLGERVLRAVTASIVLDAAAFVVLGPQLMEFYGADGDWSGVRAHPRLAAGAVLLLLIALPAAAAATVSVVQRRVKQGRYLPTPTAWEHMFHDRLPCYVRARLKDGRWVGGWYGPGSFVTTYPHPPTIYLTVACRMHADGSFQELVRRSAGIHLRGEDIDVLELLSNEE